MKRVADVISAAVGFFLLAVIIVLTITYFNRGKDITVKNADTVLGAAENVTAGIIDIGQYDGKSVRGSEVISIIESLPGSGSGIRVLVYTNGGMTVAEYTEDGATAKDKITITPAPASAAKQTGNYRVRTDDTYINPLLSYTVACHYTANKVLDFVTITQQ